MTAKKNAHRIRSHRRSSPAEEKLKYHIRKAYSEFWEKKYSCGSITPLFQYEEVLHMLEIAAQVSAHIRQIYETEHPGADPKTFAGKSHEYLWSLEQHPKKFPDQFIRQMVHHTFQDEQGYFEGLNDKRIDRIMDKYLHSHNITVPTEDIPSLLERLKTSWLDVDRLMHQFLAETQPENVPVLTSRMKRVIKSLNLIESEIQDWVGDSEKHKTHSDVETGSVSDASDTSTPATPTVSEAQEPIEPAQDQPEESGEHEEKPQQTTEQKVEDKPESTEQHEEKKVEIESGSEEKEQQPENKEKEQGIPIEVKKVNEEVQTITTEVKSLIDRAELLKFEDLVKNPEEGVKEIETYQKQCLKYSEMLMRDLLSLDQLQLTDEARPARKKTVQNIQQLLDNLDAITVQLRGQLKKIKDQQKVEEKKQAQEAERLQKEEKERKAKEEQEKASKQTPEEKKQQEEQERKQKEEQERQEKEERARKEREEQERKQREEQARKQREEKEQKLREAQERERKEREERERVEQEQSQVSGEKSSDDSSQMVPAPHHNLESKRAQIQESSNKWALLKLPVDFEVHEKKDCYLMSAYLPGMNEKDLQITLHNGNTILKIEGVRCPTPDEEQIMIKKLDHFLPNVPAHDKQMYLLRLGAGQFGKFSESYRVPQDVDPDQIRASYRRGVLQVILAKKVAYYAPPPVFSPFISPFEVPRQRRAPAAGTGFPFDFFEDPELWW